MVKIRLSEFKDNIKLLKCDMDEMFIRERDCRNELRDLQRKYEHLNDTLDSCQKRNCELELENDELRHRNNNQYKQLNELFELIAKKDWEALTRIIDDFKRCDEQLQKEWESYSEVETLELNDMNITHILKLIDEKIEEADYYRTLLTKIPYKDDLGYWNGVYQKMKGLKKELLKWLKKE